MNDPVISFSLEDPQSVDAKRCLDGYFATLSERFDQPFDRNVTNALNPDDMRLPAGGLIVGRIDAVAVACGALKMQEVDVADVKHVWVSHKHRGSGLGKALMSELESLALEQGYKRIRLDTNRNLTEAIAMYRRLGYREVEAFNDEPYAHHWFEKSLDA